MVTSLYSGNLFNVRLLVYECVCLSIVIILLLYALGSETVLKVLRCYVIEGVCVITELEQSAALKYLYQWLRHHPKYGTLSPGEMPDSLYYADVRVITLKLHIYCLMSSVILLFCVRTKIWSLC